MFAQTYTVLTYVENVFRSLHVKSSSGIHIPQKIIVVNNRNNVRTLNQSGETSNSNR